MIYSVIAMALAQEHDPNLLEEIGTRRSSTRTWAEAFPMAVLGRIQDVRVSKGLTEWDVAVVEALGRWPAGQPESVMSVVQPYGCDTDGQCVTHPHGVVNTDLPIGIDILIAFGQAPPRVGSVGLFANQLYFRDETRVVLGTRTILGFDCQEGAGGRTGEEARDLMVAASQAGAREHTLPEARVGVMEWSAFLMASRTCLAAD